MERTVRGVAEEMFPTPPKTPHLCDILSVSPKSSRAIRHPARLFARHPAKQAGSTFRQTPMFPWRIRRPVRTSQKPVPKTGELVAQRPPPPLVQRAKQPIAVTEPPLDLSASSNPYRARKAWPPDFDELTPQQQLRFEKKYKRRCREAWRSKTPIKTIIFIRRFLSILIMLWLIFYGDLEIIDNQWRPSQEHRDYVNNFFGLLDPAKRYDWRKDAPVLPPLPEDPEEGLPRSQPASKEDF